MGILLGLYTVIKYLFSIIFTGVLNFNVEIIFWIINGILLGPFIGTIFSFLCDIVFCFITSGIAYWMIEYAIVAPLSSLITWLLWKMFNLYKKNKMNFVLPSIVFFVLVSSTLIAFFYQLIKKEFFYESTSSKNIIPWLIYLLILFLLLSLSAFYFCCIFLYKRKKDFKYIRWLQIFTIVSLIIILFRWIWGPYAYIEFSRRFFSKDINFSKQYLLTLIGIIMKSCVSLPIATFILIPLILVINKLKNKFLNFKQYN